MVTVVDDARLESTSIGRSPLVVELVGPAGAGKTTISMALTRRSAGILESNFPYVRSVMDTSFFVRHGLLLAPTLFCLPHDNGRWLTRREIAWMMILNGWHHVLRRQSTRSGKIIVLDQGPIFLLAELDEFGPKCLQNPSAERWWAEKYGQWAATLDIVVWLDTSDDCLLERIRTRAKWHLMKDAPAPEVFEFLARYRVAYEKVISNLTANSHGPKVLRFDTDRESLDGIVNRLLFEFGLKLGEE